MALDFKSISDTGSSLGGAVSSIFGAIAAGKEEDLYRGKAEEAITERDVTEDSERLQQYAASRKIAETLGAQQAATAAAGFQESGSALDLLRESTTQGALTHATLQMQAGIKEAGYTAENKAAENEASAAGVAGLSDTFGAVIKGVTGAAQLAMMG